MASLVGLDVRISVVLLSPRPAGRRRAEGEDGDIGAVLELGADELGRADDREAEGPVTDQTAGRGVHGFAGYVPQRLPVGFKLRRAEAASQVVGDGAYEVRGIGEHQGQVPVQVVTGRGTLLLCERKFDNCPSD